jgi:hypothetical protein
MAGTRRPTTFPTPRITLNVYDHDRLLITVWFGPGWMGGRNGDQYAPDNRLRNLSDNERRQFVEQTKAVLFVNPVDTEAGWILVHGVLRSRAVVDKALLNHKTCFSSARRKIYSRAAQDGSNVRHHLRVR